MQSPFVSVVLIGLALIAVPAAVCAGIIALIERTTPRRTSPEGTAGTWKLGGIAAALGLILSTAILEGLFRVIHSEAVVAFAVPISLVIVLLVGARRARHEIAGPLALALGGTVGCALYYAVETLVTGVGDGTGLWAVGILYAWACCGVPLAVAAVLRIALRSGRTPRRA
ncbi:hypothetical protein [Corynebacterium mastitidis]|uniref:hypothetical protein n=1 Tax=Corynebacterium mastitidis TaxID=161890 RepID=UPI00037706B0|nr:hypothetical protein [Corynebacterium mastitidis]